MKQKYNLALIPMNINSDIIKISQPHSNVADKYLLGNHSLSHITLYQFKMETIDSLWRRVCELWKEKPITLEFNQFSCVTFDNKIYCISLMPNNRDMLLNMHVKIAGIIGFPSKENFDPHMSLFTTQNKNYKNRMDELSRNYIPLKDNFILSLGKSDEVGQLTEIIYKAS